MSGKTTWRIGRERTIFRHLGDVKHMQWASDTHTHTHIESKRIEIEKEVDREREDKDTRRRSWAEWKYGINFVNTTLLFFLFFSKRERENPFHIGRTKKKQKKNSSCFFLLVVGRVFPKGGLYTVTCKPYPTLPAVLVHSSSSTSQGKLYRIDGIRCLVLHD